jgi:hypothetical protein
LGSWMCFICLVDFHPSLQWYFSTQTSNDDFECQVWQGEVGGEDHACCTPPSEIVGEGCGKEMEYEKVFDVALVALSLVCGADWVDYVDYGNFLLDALFWGVLVENSYCVNVSYLFDHFQVAFLG